MAYNNSWGTKRNSNYASNKQRQQPAPITADNITIQEVQKIEKNYEKYLQLISTIEDTQAKDAFLKLATELKSRLSVAPSATRVDFVGAYAGGLIQTSLFTLRNMLKMNEALELNIPKDDLIIAALSFGIGKIGSKDKEYYVAQTSAWHIERGMRYEINKDIEGIMSPNVRSLWWLSQYGVKLSENVMYAIQSLSTLTDQAPSSLDLFQAPPLAILLQSSFRLVCSAASNTPKKSVLE